MRAKEVVFEFRQAKFSDFVASGRVLRTGEPAYFTDTGEYVVGDGVQQVADLPVFSNKENILAYIQAQIESAFADGTADPRVGDLDDLTTEDKSNLVSAINELNMSGVSWVSLYHNAKAG